MRRFYTRMAMFVLLVGFCIFFGVDIANRGMERIQGPQPPAGPSGAVRTAVPVQPVRAGPAPASRAAAATPALAPGTAAPPAPPKPDPVRADRDEALNYVGNKVGDLLQIAAHHTIRLVVSFFSSLIG
ncbi:hypothetical protein SD70_29845 [Gordoniibacillus kamchatkensis]|uniref:Translation initiation factor IF-2 n=1 Tax=Gordoniibacillus kamchatkensis TaxID=1590651 RepID=A0ABR5AC12_9BACL|nr:hypothetical protein [Paenibacillus sp. VKM B-2647]KIL37917.1 hypothetical protein SD70_29845 [Paenibacillus sp. VKM B-2647]